MSKRSFIGRKIKDDRLEVVYGKFDGNIEHFGKILHERYNSEEKIEGILELGSFADLGHSLECPADKSYKKETKDMGFVVLADEFNPRKEISLNRFIGNSWMISYAYIWDDKKQDYEVYGYGESCDSKFGLLGMLSALVKEI